MDKPTSSQMPMESLEPQQFPPPPLEAPPSYNAITTPFGLEQLSTLSRVDIRQKQITTEHGEVIFGLKRELIRKGCSATFFFDLYDKTGRKVIGLKPVNACCAPRVEVSIDGQYASKLTASSVLVCNPKYVVSDAKGKKVLKIYPPGFGQAHRFLLRLKDLQGNQIGSITKKWHGLAEELFVDSNELQIDFPRELAVQYKAAVIGFCIVLIQDANVQYQYR